MRDRDIYFTLKIYMNMPTFPPLYKIYLLCFFILSVIIVLLKPSLLSVSIQTMLTSFLNQSVSLNNWEDWFSDACSEGAINMYMYWTQTDSTVSSLNMYYLIVMYCCRCFSATDTILQPSYPETLLLNTWALSLEKKSIQYQQINTAQCSNRADCYIIPSRMRFIVCLSTCMADFIQISSST